MMMTVNEVSKLAGVSIRTLQYYDKIGLLHPTGYTDAGYRLYDDADLERLQHILLFRELEFPLKDIKMIVNSPDFDRSKALEQQIELLRLKKEHIENLMNFALGIKLLGVKHMDFKAFDRSKLDEYSRQAKELYGNTPEYKEMEEKQKNRTEEDEKILADRFMLFFKEAGEMKNMNPASDDAQNLVRRLQDYITQNLYTCTNKILRGLGKMYSGGGDITTNIDAYGGEGTAIFVADDEYGISAHRTTVTKDIAALQEFGMDIVTIHSTQSKYFVASRKFELPELKLLIDAVESSKFITKKKSETLIEKIHTMTSPGQVAKLKRNNYVVNRIKPDNEQIYYIIDAINDAINAGKQISFQYYDYTGLKKKVLKNKGEVYKLSPYKLLWCGDYYYVLGYSEKKSKVINFRVDRIASKPEILDKDIIPMPDDFDIENYTKEVFFMFSGEKVLVDLRCDNSLMKTMVDRFGEDVTTLAYDMTSFRVQTEVSASPTFFGWVFGFNGKVQILAPESVKEQYRQMIAKADEDMQESE